MIRSMCSSVSVPVGACLLAAGAAACRGEALPADEIPNDAAVGPLEVDIGGDARLSGNAGEVSSNVEEVWLRFEDVQVNHEDKGWVGVLDTRTDVDLLALRGDEPGLLAAAEVYEGGYDALRLVVADAWIVVDGVEYDLGLVDSVGLPTGAELTYDETFFVDRNTTTVLWVGWDLDTQLSEGDDGWTLGTQPTLDVDLLDD